MADMTTAAERASGAANQAPDIEEDTIDLRKYINVLVHRWRLIFTLTVLATIAGLIYSLMYPPGYEGVAGVAIVKTRTDLTLDPRFKTMSNEELAAAGATQAMNVEARRQALVSLVQNGDIAQAIIEQFKDQLEPGEQNPAGMLRRVKSAIVNKGDLIEIRIGDTNPAMAAALANAWAKEYEQYANALFSGAPTNYSDSVGQEVSRTLKNYEQTQVVLEAFIADNQIDDLSRQIAEKQNVVNSLQKGREQVVNAAVETNVKLHNEAIAAYLAAQSTNRLFPFQKEQEANRALVAAYIDAQNSARQAVLSQQTQDKLNTLAGYYDTRARTIRLMADASAMRQQVIAGGGLAATTNALALQLLKAQAFAGSAALPGQLQVQVNATEPAELADIDGLIASLQQRITGLDARITALSAQLLNGEGYAQLPAIITTTTSASNTLAVVLRQNYPQLFTVGEIGQLGDTVNVTNDLASRLKQRSAEALRATSSALSISDADWQQSAAQITNLQKDIRAMQSKLEQQNATKQQLTLARDMASDAYQTLARKQTEVNIAGAVANSEVRFALPAVVPDARAGSRWTPAIMAALAGLILGVLAAYLAEFAGATSPNIPADVRRRKPWLGVYAWVMKVGND